MFASTSRYATLETAIHTMPDGREVAYVRRRFLPRGETTTPKNLNSTYRNTNRVVLFIPIDGILD